MASVENDSSQPLLAVVRKPRRSFVLEPVVILYSLGLFGLVPISTQFVFVQIGHKYNYTQSGIGNDDNTTKCSKNTSDPNYILQQMVETEAATFSLYSALISSLPAIVSALYIGGYTDKRGRRLGILLPLFGTLIQALIYIPVIYFDLNIYFLLIGSFLNGACGYVTVFLMAVFAYVADCTAHETRSRRIVVMEVLTKLGSFISSFSLGYMITFLGFLWPTILMAALLALAFLYTLFFVPETIVRQSHVSIDVLNILKKGLDVFLAEKSSRRPIKLFVMLLALCLFFLVVFSGQSVRSYFLINSPLCFTTFDLGIFSAVNSLIVAIGVVVGILLFMKVLKLSDSSIILIATISFMAHNILFGFSETSLLAYAALGAGIFDFLCIPVLRSAMSKIVNASEQGSLFSFIATVEGICSFGGSFLWNLVYSKTVGFCNGFTFFSMAFVCLMSFIVVAIHKFAFPNTSPEVVKDERQERAVQYGT